MESLHASDDLDEEEPELLLGKVRALLFVSIDELHHVAAICVLHDDTQRGSGVLKKGFLVADDIGVAD